MTPYQKALLGIKESKKDVQDSFGHTSIKHTGTLTSKEKVERQNAKPKGYAPMNKAKSSTLKAIYKSRTGHNY